MKKEQINIRDPFVVYENGKYYMLATFTQKNGLRGTYSLRAEFCLFEDNGDTVTVKTK